MLSRFVNWLDRFEYKPTIIQDADTDSDKLGWCENCNNYTAHNHTSGKHERDSSADRWFCEACGFSCAGWDFKELE